MKHSEMSKLVQEKTVNIEGEAILNLPSTLRFNGSEYINTYIYKLVLIA